MLRKMKVLFILLFASFGIISEAKKTKSGPPSFAYDDEEMSCPRAYYDAQGKMHFYNDCDYSRKVHPDLLHNSDLRQRLDAQQGVPVFKCPSRFGNFPHPTDCGSFFHCEDRIAYVRPCPYNLHFNPALQLCDYPKDAVCQISPSFSTDKCPTSHRKYSVPDDCSAYVVCDTETAHYMHCDEKDFFDEEGQRCVKDHHNYYCELYYGEDRN